eukprot:6206890-Pleurochrysis_carterae.AAC.1
MEGAGRLTTAIAEAAGRPAAAAALTSADSAPALRAAAREWRELWARSPASRGAAGPPPAPADWGEAADRLLEVLAGAAGGGAAGGGAAPGGQHGQAPPPPPPPPRAVKDLPLGSTAKLMPLKADTGAAARRAADASVLQPLCAFETLQAEVPFSTATAPVPAVTA